MSMSEIERVEKISRLNQIADKVSEGAVLTTADRDEFEGIEIALRADNAEHEQWHGPRNPGDVSTLSRETQAKVNANRALIGTETHHLPEPGDGRPLEAATTLPPIFRSGRTSTQPGLTSARLTVMHSGAGS